MIQYKDYLERLIQYYSGLPEDDFIEVIKLFPNVQELNWSEYNPEDFDLSYFIIDSLIGSIDSGAYIDDYDEYTKSISLSYVYSLEELENLKNILESNGWDIDNYESLKEELEEEKRQLELEDYKNSLIQEIRNKASLDQLEEFIEGL